jgi:hypothetical protein
MDYRACQGAGDSLDALDLGEDEPPDGIDVCRPNSRNHVVRAGNDVGSANLGYTAEGSDYLSQFGDLRLD